jgi:alpha-acetolactate decarboxylase
MVKKIHHSYNRVKEFNWPSTREFCTMNSRFVLMFLISLALYSCSTPPTHKDVAWREDDFFLSELTNAKHLYAVGSASQKDGELTVIDGVCYIAQINEQDNLHVSEDCSQKSPFLVYSYYSNWKGVQVKRPIKSLKDLSRNMTELLIENGYITEDSTAIMIQAEVKDLEYQIAHKGKTREFTLENTKVTMVGFYTKDQGSVFTDKGSNLHMHFVAEDKSSSGHVNDFFIQAGSKFKLYFPLKR